MMVLLNNQTPDSIAVAVERIVDRVFKALRASEFPEKSWDADKIVIETQFPFWIQKLYSQSPSNAPVIDFFKYYYRWLFDYEDGYGCGFYIENFRDISNIKSDFLQAYADEIFRGDLDLSSYPELVDNFRKFYLYHDRDYLRLRGTPDGIAYILKSLFGATTVSAVTVAPGLIQITSNVNSSYENLIKTISCPFGYDVTFIYS